MGGNESLGSELKHIRGRLEDLHADQEGEEHSVHAGGSLDRDNLGLVAGGLRGQVKSFLAPHTQASLHRGLKHTLEAVGVNAVKHCYFEHSLVLSIIKRGNH